MVFDNKAEKASKDRQVKRLVLTIRRLLEVNGGRPFTNKLLDIVERCMQQREQELQEEQEGSGRGGSGDGRYVLCTGTAGGTGRLGERRIRRWEVRTVYRNCRGKGGPEDGRYVLCTADPEVWDTQDTYIQGRAEEAQEMGCMYNQSRGLGHPTYVRTADPGVRDTQDAYAQPIQGFGTPEIYRYIRMYSQSRRVGTLKICTYVQPNQGVGDTQDMYVCTADPGVWDTHDTYVCTADPGVWDTHDTYVCTADPGVWDTQHMGRLMYP